MTAPGGPGPLDGVQDAKTLLEIFSRARLPDDCCQYSILLIDPSIQTISELRQQLQKVKDAARELEKKYLKDFPWQRDSFNLSLTSSQKTATSGLPLAWILQGTTNFGDSNSDEWLIVWLLRELSKRFPSVWIRIDDTDGEFLLVEAADVLPKWLNPEIADNRVWLHEGKLVIIPLSNEDGDSKSSNLSLEQATAFLSTSPEKLLYNPAIEAKALHHIDGYPATIDTTLHNAMVRIPRRLAYVLHEQPALVSPATEAYYLRDPVSVKPLDTKDLQTLVFPPHDLVEMSLRFSRIGFAQLFCGSYTPPSSWMTAFQLFKDQATGVGMRLTVGFEIMMQEAANKDRRAVREINLLLSDLDSGGVSLPTDAEVESWGAQQDSDEWLKLNVAQFEEESKRQMGGTGVDLPDETSLPAEERAQFRKMAARFNDFMKNGEEEGEDESEDDAESTDSEDSNTEDAAKLQSDFTDSMHQVHNLSATDAEHQDLAAEARRLALEMEDEDEGLRDEDAEAAEVFRLAQEIRAKRNKGKAKADDGNEHMALAELSARATSATQRGFVAGRTPATGLFGGKDTQEIDGEYELSSDEDEGENDVDLDLMRNLIKSLDGQQGSDGSAKAMLEKLVGSLPKELKES